MLKLIYNNSNKVKQKNNKLFGSFYICKYLFSLSPLKMLQKIICIFKIVVISAIASLNTEKDVF